MSSSPRPNSAPGVKVLLAPYQGVDFCINRSQCSSSVYIAQTQAVASPCPWLREGLVLQGGMYPLWDLDGFLSKTFCTAVLGDARLALVRERKSLAEPLQTKLAAVDEGFADRELVAFRIASATVMQELSFDELTLSPPVLAAHLEQNGLLAVMFSGERGIRYLIDLDVLLERHMLGGTDHANTDC